MGRFERAALCHASALPAELWPHVFELGSGGFVHKPAPQGRLLATCGLRPNHAFILTDARGGLRTQGSADRARAEGDD